MLRQRVKGIRVLEELSRLKVVGGNGVGRGAKGVGGIAFGRGARGVTVGAIPRCVGHHVTRMWCAGTGLVGVVPPRGVGGGAIGQCVAAQVELESRS
jgi:hypothetical protein